MPLADGQVFAGYTIERVLGTGGMGEVYLAEHPRLPRHDALKVLGAAVSSDEEYRQRFNLEAEMVSTLRHPHIVTIYDRGDFEGQLWIAMEFVDGTDAARKILSTIYRVQQHSGISFGAGHIMDILRGKSTEKVTQFGHEAISTFGIGSALSELQLRGVLRQLVAIGAVAVDAQAFNTLKLTDGSRGVLKGQTQVMLRESVSMPSERRRSSGSWIC